MLFSKTNQRNSPTERCAVARLYYLERMKLVEQAAIGASAELSNYILKAVTEGWSYDVLKVQCSNAEH